MIHHISDPLDNHWYWKMRTGENSFLTWDRGIGRFTSGRILLIVLHEEMVSRFNERLARSI